jgi:hypothetical protein
MMTSNKEVVTGERLQEAREHASQINLRHAKSIRDGKVTFASHVTNERMITIAEKEEQHAKEIIEGIHDNNFTIWQRMNTFLTGECVPFLPPPK